MGKIENLGNGGEFGAGLKVNADEAQYRLVDNAEPRFHGRLGSHGAADTEINRDVQDARTFGVVHPQKEDVAPPAVAQVHAHRCGFPQDGEESVLWCALHQFRANAQGGVFRMGGPEHPLIAAHTAHTAPNLVGQRLKPE